MPRRSQITITEKTVRRKPEGKAFEIRDGELRGFILRIQPTGTKTFYCEWARGQRSRIGDANLMTVTRARDIARDRISNAKKGEVPDPQLRGGKPTLGRFIQRHYAPWTETHHKSGRINADRLLVSFKDFINTRIDQLTVWQADNWKALRKAAGIKSSTINRDILMLKAALNKAVEWGELDANPLAQIKPIRGAEKVRVRYLSGSEERRLYEALDARDRRIKAGRVSGNQWREKRGYQSLSEIPPDGFADHLFPMVIISSNTGLRYGELSSLDWANTVLTDAPLVTVEAAHAKSRKVRHVPLNATAVNALKQWKLQQGDLSGLVFKLPGGARIKSVRTAWHRILKDAGINDFHWHDLRHHFASKLAMAGVDLNTVRELLGHSSLQMTLRYAHLAPEHKAAAVALLE